MGIAEIHYNGCFFFYNGIKDDIFNLFLGSFQIILSDIILKLLIGINIFFHILRRVVFHAFQYFKLIVRIFPVFSEMRERILLHKMIRKCLQYNIRIFINVIDIIHFRIQQLHVVKLLNCGIRLVIRSEGPDFFLGKIDALTL